MTTKVEKCPTCGADAINRSEFWDAVLPNSDEARQQMYEARLAIRQYYLDLDNKKQGDIAINKAFKKIEQVFGLTYRQGEMLEIINDHPSMKKLYEE